MSLLRKASEGDVPVLERFLGSHAETSMFLRGNLEAHGIGRTDHRHGTTYWLHQRDGIVGVVACTNGGYLMCRAPNADATVWRAADAVQVGGVCVPPAVRGQGLGGAVVALQLAELREQGAKVAILFAANAAAARAYERIGFQQIGSYEVALLKAPIIVEEVRHVF